MNEDSTDVTSDQLGQLKHLSEVKFTGMLTIQASITQWSILFDQGKIVWAIDNISPHRFWQRQLLRHLPHISLDQLAKVPQSLKPEIQPEVSWPYLALVQLHVDGQIDSQKLGSLLADGAQDVFFDILQISHTEKLTYHHNSCRWSQVPPIVMTLDKLIVTPLQEWQEWQKWQLTDIFPDHIPIIDYPTDLHRQTSTAIYDSLQRIFAPPPAAQGIDDHYSLREIAIRQQQDLLLLARSLRPHLQQKTISLHPLFQDLPQPVLAVQKPLVAVEESLVEKEEVTIVGSIGSPPAFPAPVILQGVVAYIDDNAQANQHMADMITGIGYQFLGIKDPSEAIDIMHQQQPNLIIMEAAMPLTSGRQICQQIRRSGNLAKVPVILIVDQENLAERILAKLAGAASTITHPLDCDKVRKLIQRYLDNSLSIKQVS